MAKNQLSVKEVLNKKNKRGVHSKSKSSKIKGSKLYKKKYRGQGR